MVPPPVEQTEESSGVDAYKSLPTPFLTKTYQLVEDSSIDEIISWNEDGSTFIVWKPAEFARDLLPKYFKHNNFSSFVRQLNTYGFRKIVPDRWEFANDGFRRGEKKLLCDIHRRKISLAGTAAAVTVAVVAAAARVGSSTDYGDEQGHSSNSSPAAAAAAAVSATLCRATSCSSTTDLLDENERLRKENMHLTSELSQMKSLCNNIFVLMSNYASSQQENGGFPVEKEKPLDLLPAKRFSDEPEYIPEVSGNLVKTEAEEEESHETSHRLFGVSIGLKTKRAKVGDEEAEVEEEQQQSLQQQQGPEVKSEPLDQSIDHEEPPWLKYCHRPNQRVCN